MEETKKELTADEVRQLGLETLQDSLYGYSINGDDDGEKATGLAALYKEIMADDTNRKNAKWELLAKILLGVGSIGAIVANLWMFKRSTDKESDEIYDTTTKKEVVRSGLTGRFFHK